MTAVLIVVIVLLIAALGALVCAPSAASPSADRSHVPGGDCRRILFPFVASALSQRALDAALRLARAEDATLVPVFLARVPLHLPLDSPLPRQSGIAIPLQEAIEHRAAAFGVPVDARIERGRTDRHALRQTDRHERFDRIVVAAAADGAHGFDPEDIAWVLENAPGEIVVLRPGTEDPLAPHRSGGRARRGGGGARWRPDVTVCSAALGVGDDRHPAQDPADRHGQSWRLKGRVATTRRCGPSARAAATGPRWLWRIAWRRFRGTISGISTVTSASSWSIDST